MLEQAAPSLTDYCLLRSIAGQDQDAFVELYHRYERPLFNYLLRLIHERESAEDLLQETFLAIWDGAAGFRGRSSVKTWMFRIAHYKAVNWLRRSQNKESEPLFESFIEPTPGVESQAIRSMRLGETRVALDRLSTEQRAVVELCFYHGMSYGEIADVLNCPVGTVKSRMAYARRILAAVLSDLEPEA